MRPKRQNQITIMAALTPEELFWSFRAILAFVRDRKNRMGYDKVVLAIPTYPILPQILLMDRETIIDEIMEIPRWMVGYETFTENQRLAVRGESKDLVFISSRKIREYCAAKSCHFSVGAYHYLKMTPPVNAGSMRPLFTDHFLLGMLQERQSPEIDWQLRPVLFIPSIPDHREQNLYQVHWTRFLNHAIQGKCQSVAIPEFVPGLDRYLEEIPRAFVVRPTTILELAFWVLYSSMLIGEETWITHLGISLDCKVLWVGFPPLSHLANPPTPNIHYIVSDEPGAITHDRLVHAFTVLSSRYDIRRSGDRDLRGGDLHARAGSLDEEVDYEALAGGDRIGPLPEDSGGADA